MTAPSDAERFDPIGIVLDGIWSEFAGDDTGQVADYIPQLSRADPQSFGLALVGVAGSVYRAGEANTPFTIQIMMGTTKIEATVARTSSPMT